MIIFRNGSSLPATGKTLLSSSHQQRHVIKDINKKGHLDILHYDHSLKPRQGHDLRPGTFFFACLPLFICEVSLAYKGI